MIPPPKQLKFTRPPYRPTGHKKNENGAQYFQATYQRHPSKSSKWLPGYLIIIISNSVTCDINDFEDYYLCFVFSTFSNSIFKKPKILFELEKDSNHRKTFVGGGFKVGGGAESTLFSSGMAEFDENLDGIAESRSTVRKIGSFQSRNTGFSKNLVGIFWNLPNIAK